MGTLKRMLERKYTNMRKSVHERGNSTESGAGHHVGKLLRLKDVTSPDCPNTNADPVMRSFGSFDRHP